MTVFMEEASSLLGFHDLKFVLCTNPFLLDTENQMFIFFTENYIKCFALGENYLPKESNSH